MSPVALGLDVLLIALLGVALTVGWRLNRRLNAVRDGQARFVAAVAELDQAATRAEAALTALRAASEDTHDALLTRIETARGLIQKLESVSHEAEKVRAAALAAPVSTSPVRAEGRLDPRFREIEQRLAARRAPPRGLDDDLFEAEEPPIRTGSFHR